MFKPIFAAFVVLGSGLTAACGDAGAGRTPTTDEIAYPEGFPFAVRAVSVSDLCDNGPSQSCDLAIHPPPGATLVELHQPEPGRLCMAGAVGKGGWAFIALSFAVYDDDSIEQSLDADSLGITQVRLKLDGPPSTGIIISGTVAKDVICPVAPHRECRAGGFALTDPKANQVLEFKKSTEVVMPLSDFVQQDSGGMRDFDTSKLEGFIFGVNSAGPAGFCLSDFEFLDADGNVVAP